MLTPKRNPHRVKGSGSVPLIVRANQPLEKRTPLTDPQECHHVGKIYCGNELVPA